MVTPAANIPAKHDGIDSTFPTVTSRDRQSCLVSSLCLYKFYGIIIGTIKNTLPQKTQTSEKVHRWPSASLPLNSQTVSQPATWHFLPFCCKIKLSVEKMPVLPFHAYLSNCCLSSYRIPVSQAAKKTIQLPMLCCCNLLLACIHI